jgi:hypothetical protein
MIRKLLVAVLFFAVGGFLLCLQVPLDAQGKKDDPAKQIQSLKKTLAEKEEKIQQLELQISKLKLNEVKDDGKIAQLQLKIKQLEEQLKGKKPTTPDKTSLQLKKDLEAANQSIKDKDALIASLQAKAPKATADLSKEVEKLRKNVKDLEAVKNAPFVHSLILKLKKEDDEQVKLISDEAQKTLAKIGGVRGVWIGKRSDLGTPELAQKGYQLGMVVLLDDAAALQKFLEDPLHKQFTDKMADYWDRPTIYDFQRDEK